MDPDDRRVSTTALRARCPLCRRSVALMRDHTGRQVYVVHGNDVLNADQCKASCWIAEDDELIGVTERKVRSDAGRASPSRRMTKEHTSP